MQAVFENLDVLLEGMRTTASLTVTSFAFALAIGILVATARVGPVPPLRWAGAVYVELFRNTPLAVLMVLYLFGLPKVGILFTPYVTALIALSLYTGAFVAETVRSGINTVSSGQLEAARGLGLRFTQVLAAVVVPQALRSVVAPLGSIFSALIRNSAVAFTISVPELSGRVDDLINQTAQTVPLLVGAAVAYLMLTIPSGLAFGVLERRVAIKR
ncbi:MAG: amino acid ABC transporter permease [Acidimicrobiia bacterium]